MKKEDIFSYALQVVTNGLQVTMNDETIISGYFKPISNIPLDNQWEFIHRRDKEKYSSGQTELIDKINGDNIKDIQVVPNPASKGAEW